MSHEISIRSSNGYAEMAFVGEVPWHKLGHAIDPSASIEEWMLTAGLEWLYNEAPVQFAIDGNTLEASAYKVIYRSDTGEPLSVVGSRFHPVQPREVLEFFREFVELGGMKLHTAGALKGGRKIWALAKNGLVGEVVPGDQVRGNLLLASACDGTLATTAKLTAIRVVCANTLSAAISDGAPQVKVSHRSRFNAKHVQAQLGQLDLAFRAFLDQMTALALKRFSPTQARELLHTLLVRPMRAKEVPTAIAGPALAAVDGRIELATLLAKTKAEPAPEPRAVEKVLTLFNGEGMGARHEGVFGTGWGLLNAFTQYVDHDLGRTDDSRIDSAWFGRGDELKTEFVRLLRAA